MPVLNEITVVVSKDKLKATSKGGAVANGTVHKSPLSLATIKVFEELLLDDKIETRRHMEVLGEHLYNVLFSDDAVNQLLNEKLQEVKTERLRLQLQFEMDVDFEIASLPWEFLYSPVRQNFLATDVNLVLSRYMELGKDREVLSPFERPLRALIVISRPQDEGTVLANEVVNKIKSLNEEGKEQIIDIEVLERPTLANIEEALKRQPHVFHFIGHGKYDSVTQKGHLLLVNPQTNNSDPCDDSTLIDQFKSAQCFPRLVFLHMCEGGASQKDASSLQAFSGFAPKLIHAKIPSVVAMRYPIKNEPAKEFSLVFYSTLAEGGSVDEGVQEGRRKLDLYRRSRLFGTPVLYMHSVDGLVLPRKAPPQTQTAGSPGTTPPTRVLPDQAAEQQAAGAGPEPASPAILDQVIEAGFEAANEIADDNKKFRLRQSLLKMKPALAKKTSTDIFNALFEAWQKEADPHLKQVWETLMQTLPDAS